MVQKITSRPGQEAYLTGPNETLSIPMIGASVISDGDVVVRTTDGKSVALVSGATTRQFLTLRTCLQAELNLYSQSHLQVMKVNLHSSQAFLWCNYE
ncbi:hypothetical protein [Acinetobacter sp. TUM15064]|uniref:hypothetical protein n=1 Tax=Acinetobacter sp. TUM15064 TaxID=2609134 RepID=UPI00124DAF2A|nr:hypothetical protein [Acinetobacter sp. TUM15064]